MVSVTFEDFQIKCAMERKWGDGQRVGQSYMNTLAEVRPELYRDITGTEADPFYSNGRLANFWKWLGENW